MRLSRGERARAAEPGMTAAVRIDRHTKYLTKRLRPGEIAIIDHVDLDRVSAEALVACRAGAVVNIAPSISGRYPNLGPAILLEAGIPLVDEAGGDLFDCVVEGEVLRLHEGTLYRADAAVAAGQIANPASVEAAMAAARAGLSDELKAFVTNTMEHLEREHTVLLDPLAAPTLRTRLDGRHVLIVVRGPHYREDLAALRPYLREYRPVLIGVDGGADALLEAGFTPDLIVGDMDSVSDKALSCGAELVVHAYADGEAPGLARLERLGRDAVTLPAIGTSEDVAMLLADDAGADLIVAVGTHANLEEFLDKGRDGMASTFLTRLRVGSKLIDAKGVSRLYRSRISNSQLLLLLLAALVTMAVAVTASPSGRAIMTTLGARWDDIDYWLHGLF
ncbi:MAG TPA: putative cytokinetic ring protein SteA [Sporichthyaceae bacterium]|nr:putative cytokinetic ring protein SteA [Sporichthyaceae bacterium]